MKKRVSYMVLFGCLLFSLQGCVVYNLEPLYEVKDLLTKPDFTGTWTDPEKKDEKGSMTFVRQPDGTYSVVFVENDGKESRYTCGFVRLGGQIFMDATAESSPPAESLLLKANAILRITFKGQKFKMELLNSAWLKEKLTTGQLKTSYVLEGDDVVLTSSTPDLQKFIAGIGNNDQAFSTDDNYLQKN